MSQQDSPGTVTAAQPSSVDSACRADEDSRTDLGIDELGDCEPQGFGDVPVPDPAGSGDALAASSSLREKVLPYLVAALLAGFGAYQSILYFGHQPVPNSDFPSFLRVGRELLSFQVPSSFKRAPVVGLLQVGLSYVAPGSHPELTAGWLLNAILHPCSIVLLWLIARRIVGRWADGVALVAAINPWLLHNIRAPIAETTLYFFILVTLYCIFTKSRWRYVVASVATMVRYDAAALILVAFVLDLVQSRDIRQRIRSFGYASAAAVPLAIWVLATVMNLRGEAATHYWKEFGAAGGSFFSVLTHYLGSIWVISVSPLFCAPPSLPEGAAMPFLTCVGIPIFVGFGFGVVHSIAERRWEILGLLIFLLAYVTVHTLHSFVFARACSMIHWMILLIAAYGLRSCWLAISGSVRLSARQRIILQGVAALALALWVIDVASLLPLLASDSVRSISMPYVSMAIAALLIIAGWVCLGMKRPVRDVLVLTLLLLVVVSNQRRLVPVMGNGQEDMEFKLLADWFRDHAEPQDKLVTTYAGIVELFLPDRKTNIMHTAEVKADDPQTFIANCRTRGVTLIAWDSRLGTHPENRYYAYYGLASIAPLAQAQSSGPYELVTQIRAKPGRWINLFRLR